MGHSQLDSRAAHAILACIVTCALVVCGQDFGYGGLHGPEHWGDDYKRCSGKYQSPINIDVLNVVKKSFPDLEYYNFDATPKSIHVTNNGHTVLVTMNYDEATRPRVNGGPLERQSDYQFEQFHFHWGENDTVGSEDMINNQSYPAELHVVMRSRDYPDFQSALGQDHGIAVLAFFFKVQDEDNLDYDEFAETLSTITQKNMSSDLTKRLPLQKFLSMDLDNYFSYIGSLTTPPCAEEVVWIDYSQPIGISEHQLNHFRALTANDDHLKNNFRPTQPLNNRTVYENIPKIPDIVRHPHNSIPFVNAANAAVNVMCMGIATLFGSSLFVLLLKDIQHFSGF